MKAPILTLQQVVVRLEEQALETASLREELTIQFTRIAQMQVRLDRQEQRQTRQLPRALALTPIKIQTPSHNGNGNGSSHR